MVEIEGIQNYYESQVTSAIEGMPHLLSEFDGNQVMDIVCIALNRLPTKYYRHSIDLSFYTSTAEQEKIDLEISEAISYAAHRVRSHPKNQDSIN